MTMNNLFANASNTASNEGRGLEGTAQLTSITNAFASAIIDRAKTDEELMETVAASMVDMKILDNLVSDYEYDLADYNFMYDIDDTVADQMLKSQQSKRSRCKSKVMSEDNYKSMLSAAAAEFIIRKVTGKDKSDRVGSRGGVVQYTEDQLQAFAEDQQTLRKEIRNIQSKKSIMKSKAGFTEEDERWQALLVAEEQLKSVRIDKVRKAAKADTLREDLKELTAEIDPQSMKAADLKELLTSIKNMVWGDAEDAYDEEPMDEVI